MTNKRAEMGGDQYHLSYFIVSLLPSTFSLPYQHLRIHTHPVPTSTMQGGSRPVILHASIQEKNRESGRDVRPVPGGFVVIWTVLPTLCHITLALLHPPLDIYKPYFNISRLLNIHFLIYSKLLLDRNLINYELFISVLTVIN